jgi:hypothetical protein
LKRYSWVLPLWCIFVILAHKQAAFHIHQGQAVKNLLSDNFTNNTPKRQYFRQLIVAHFNTIFIKPKIVRYTDNRIWLRGISIMYCIIKSAISLALLFEIYIIFEKITTVFTD